MKALAWWVAFVLLALPAGSAKAVPKEVDSFPWQNSRHDNTETLPPGLSKKVPDPAPDPGPEPAPVNAPSDSAPPVAGTGTVVEYTGTVPDASLTAPAPLGGTILGSVLDSPSLPPVAPVVPASAPAIEAASPPGDASSQGLSGAPQGVARGVQVIPNPIPALSPVFLSFLTLSAIGLGAIGGYTLRPPRVRPKAPTVFALPTVEDLFGRVRSHPLDGQAHFQLGVELIRLGVPEVALHHLNRSFRLRPDALLRLLEDPAYVVLRGREDVRRLLRQFHREQQRRIWAGYA